MKQFLLTPSMSKRLIGKAMGVHPAIQAVLEKGTLVIIAGTTNGYVAEEILEGIAQAEGFWRKGFRRGLVTPPDFDTDSVKAELPGDVVIVDGAFQKGKTIFDVVDDLSAGDVILKGANAVNVERGEAGVYIGDPQGGTAAAAIRAVVGRRVQLIVPVGLQKRVGGGIMDLAAKVNAPDAQGPRMLPLPGVVFTELDSIRLLTGAAATLIAAGGVYGAEGSVFLGVCGAPQQIKAAEKLINSIAREPPCEV